MACENRLRAGAVDIIGVWNRRAVYFIEIKDYRQHPRQKNEDPWVEFELKVRDTVAALVGASRREEYAADCGPLLDALIKHRDLVLVFWLEEPANSNILNVAMEKRRLAGASFRTRQVKSHLKWLRAKVVSARRSDDYSRFIPGFGGDQPVAETTTNNTGHLEAPGSARS